MKKPELYTTLTVLFFAITSYFIGIQFIKHFELSVIDHIVAIVIGLGWWSFIGLIVLLIDLIYFSFKHRE